MLKKGLFWKIKKVTKNFTILIQKERAQLILDLKVLRELAYQAAQIPKGGSLLFQKSTSGC